MTVLGNGVSLERLAQCLGVHTSDHGPNSGHGGVRKVRTAIYSASFTVAQGWRVVGDFVGRAVPRFTEGQHLNLDYAAKARIDQDLCIKCGRCHVACEEHLAPGDRARGRTASAISR